MMLAHFRHTKPEGEVGSHASKVGGWRSKRFRGDLLGWRLHGVQLILLVALLFLWQVASGRWVSKVLISRPTLIKDQLWKWVKDGSIFEHLIWTSRAALVGFILGSVSGIAIGYLLGSVKNLGRVFEPIMLALYTLPRLALAPLFIMWFGLGFKFLVAFSAVIVFFLVYFNTRSGVEDVPGEMIDAVRIMGGNSLDVALRVVFPSALVWVVVGLRISAPYALVGVVVGEMFVGNKGLGFLLSRSANQFHASGTFAAVTVLLLVGIILDRLLVRLTRRSLRWKVGSGTRNAGGA